MHVYIRLYLYSYFMCLLSSFEITNIIIFYGFPCFEGLLCVIANFVQSVCKNKDIMADVLSLKEAQTVSSVHYPLLRALSLGNLLDTSLPIPLAKSLTWVPAIKDVVSIIHQVVHLTCSRVDMWIDM